MARGAAVIHADRLASKSTFEDKRDHRRNQARGNSDLFRELIAAQADPRTGTSLLRHGVADADVRQHCGLAQIDPDTAGRFYQPFVGGVPAIVVPVLDAEELVDILAFDPRRPHRWWLRTGATKFLGGDELADLLLGPRLFTDPICVHRTPLNWLRNSCRGVVILNIDRGLGDLEIAPNGIAAEDDAHQREIRDRLTRVAMRRLPDVIVRESEGREAA